MLYFTKVRFKNFLSFGNNWTEFTFNKGITRLIGTNGQGKSVILDAIYYALFGKPYRKINIPQLVNSINKKDMIVELYFKSDDDEFKIIRGIKPGIFEIYKNDELINLTSTTRSYQQLLEQEILGFNENLANQTMFKSITKNISFLALSKNEKRSIVENILDIGMFSSMGRLCKNKIDSLDNECSSIKKDINYTRILIEQEILNIKNLAEIQTKIKEESNEKVKQIAEEIESIKLNICNYNEGLKKIAIYFHRKVEIVKKQEVLSNKNKYLREQLTDIIGKVKFSRNKIELLTNTCSACPKMKDLIENENIEQLIISKTEHETEIENNRKEIEGFKTDLSRIEEILANEKFLKGSIERAKEKIEQLEKSVSVEVQKEIIIDKTKLNKHRESIKELEQKFNELSDDKKHYQLLRTLMSDEGIKSFIINKYLPYINKLLNTYLQKFNSEILFYFDSEFNEVIGTRHKETFSYFNFSDGQRRRIDLSIMFAFLEFCKLKNAKAITNLLFLDEISAMLDAEGENGLYDLLKSFVQHENKAIINVSHSGNIDPLKIDFIYEARIEKGFSKIEWVQN